MLSKQEQQDEIWLSPIKKPLHQKKIQNATWQHKNAIKNFDNTTIADRLRTVSLSNNGRFGVKQPNKNKTVVTKKQ